MSKTVLVISPHADDETFGMGGTIVKLVSSGCKVHVVVVCAGNIVFEHGYGVVVGREKREQEFNSVINAYGCSGKMLPFIEDSYLDTVPIRKIVNEIESVQDTIRADVWYVPGMSFHQDHRKVFEACASAARPTRRAVPKEIYSYEHPLYSWNPPIWRFTPQVYEDISDVLDRKIEICALYGSQAREGVLGIKHIREYSVACGTEAGIGAAERFEVIRILR